MEQLNQALQILVDLIKSTKDFLGDQVPRVAQEIVQYAFWDSILWSIVFGLASVAMYKVLKYAIKVYREDRDYQPGVWFAGIGLIIPTVLCVICLEQAVKAKAAPRLVVLDYVESKIKVPKASCSKSE